MKKIFLSLILILIGVSTLSGCTKDEILNHYNNVVQSAGSIELTGKLSLQGKKEKGIDDYTGSYQADYENFSDTEYLFGGTSIKREAGKDISVCLSFQCRIYIKQGNDHKAQFLKFYIIRKCLPQITGSDYNNIVSLI